MTFRMMAQLWNTNTPAIVSCDADLTENYMYISMKFRTGVHVFCWEVGVFNCSCFQSVSCKDSFIGCHWIYGHSTRGVSKSFKTWGWPRVFTWFWFPRVEWPYIQWQAMNEYFSLILIMLIRWWIYYNKNNFCFNLAKLILLKLKK